MQMLLHEYAGVPAAVITSAVGGDNPPGPSPADDGTEPGACIAGLRVLIVEDEALIALELEDMLAMLGLEVVGTAQSADEAVRTAAATKPDFVTMDVSLLGARDGVSAAAEIYDRFGLRSVFITAYGDPQTAERAEPARPLGMIAKPVTTGSLAEALPRLLADLEDD